jgi:Ricin-type beta-trefoil lectin domain-like
MRYRILSIPAVIMAIMGLTASAALATATPQVPHGPYHIMANSNHSVGIAYPGTGSDVYVSSSPGSSYINYFKNHEWQIYNSNGNCLRMRDASNGYTVVEENKCNTSDESQLWYQYNAGGFWQFENVATKQFLGVSCPAENGYGVRGVSESTGNCYNWVKYSA